jgi:uncharacterized Zn finger protein (UPF0148 family)
MDTHDPQLLSRANSLYWESDASVNDIADELDLSKGALYGMIRPVDADLTCPECGGPLQYANRTARDKGIVSCPACELEEEAELVEAVSLDGPDELAPPPARVLEANAGERRVTVRTLVASTLLGLAAGLAIGQATRRS